MKKTFALILTLLLPFFVFGCRKEENFSSHTFFAMDTFVTVSAENYEEFECVEDYIIQAEELFSKTVSNSEISLINERRTFDASPVVKQVIQKSVEISENTNGAFDVAIGALVDLWDITSGKEIVPDKQSIESAKEKCGYKNIKIFDNTVSLENQVQLDLGGVVKGFYAGKTLEFFRAHGIENACISLGGNIGVVGSSKNNLKSGKSGWNVGIKNPDDTNGIIGYINVTDTTIAVSGDYERFFENNGKRYHHIFDLTTGYPSDSGLRSVAVVCGDGLVADALSTALFVMGYEKAVEFLKTGAYNVECALIREDADIFMTSIPNILDNSISFY